MSKRIFVLLHFFAVTATAQQLQPGFNKEEYKELMYVSARTTVNENYYKQLPAPAHFKMIYQSNPMGLDNYGIFGKMKTTMLSSASVAPRKMD